MNIMGLISFAEIRLAFHYYNNLTDFRCIAAPRNKSCKKALDLDTNIDRKRRAQELLRKSPQQLSLDELRDICCYILCRDCQRTGTHKKKAEAKWISEFPHFPFDTPAKKSPLSLRPKRSTTKRRRTCNGITTISEPRSTSPEEVNVDSGHSVSENNLGQRSTRAASKLSAYIRQPTSAVEIDHSITHAQDRSPSLRPRRTPQSNLRDLRAVASRLTVTQLDNRTEDTSTGEPPTSVSVNQRARRGRSYSPQIPIEELNGLFRPGKGSEYAPYRIRSDVLSLLFEPLDKSANWQRNGALYVVPVRGTRIVKIGLTAAKVPTRINALKANLEHLDEKRAHWFNNIPIPQLKRLEKLVHADLAYFRRDFKSRRSEFFEVDFDHAVKTVALFREIMRTISLEPGKEVDPSISAAVNAHPLLRADCGIDDPTQFQEINANQIERIALWRTVFRLDCGGFKEPLRPQALPPAIASLVLLVLPHLLPAVVQVFLGMAHLTFVIGIQWWRLPVK